MRKILSVILSVMMAVAMIAYIPATAFASSYDIIGKYDFDITNPYETVN